MPQDGLDEAQCSLLKARCRLCSFMLLRLDALASPSASILSSSALRLDRFFAVQLLLPLDEVGVADALALVAPVGEATFEPEIGAEVGEATTLEEIDPDPDEDVSEPELVTKSDALAQKAMRKLTLLSWHPTCTWLSLGWKNAVLQFADEQVVPWPLQPP